MLNPRLTWLKLKYRYQLKRMKANFHSYDEFFNDELENDFRYTRLAAKSLLGVDINLDNPKTYHDKLIHRRLFSRDPIWPIVTDKIKVREWLKEQGYLDYVHLLPAKVAYSIEELEAIDINKPVVVKAAWGCGMNLFVSSKKELENYKTTLEEWFTSPYHISRLIWAPHQMKRGFLIEDSIADHNGDVPLDYKFFCFNGKVEFIQIDLDRYKGHKRLILSAEGIPQNWNHKGMSKPDCEVAIDKVIVDKLRKTAEIISQSFSFIRVDLYFHNEKIYFGEMTQTPGAGFEGFTDDSISLKLGEIWEYPNSDKLGDKLLAVN